MRLDRLTLAALAAIGLALPATATATTIHVTSNADSGAQCTLRNAVTAANTNAVSGACAAGEAAPVLDTIDLVGLGGQTITLGSTLPSLSSLLAITGPGASQLTISGNNTVQPLQVAGGTITISGLKIANGRCGAGCSQEGGAIFQGAGELTLDSVSLTSNTAIAAVAAANNFAEGGAIEVQGGSTLHIVNSTISGNTVSAVNGTSQNGAAGGAIMNRGTTTIDRSTISANHATGTAAAGAGANVAGGAIENTGQLTITRSTLSANTVAGTGPTVSASGGAIAEFNNPALRLTVDRFDDREQHGHVEPRQLGRGRHRSLGFPGTVKSSTISGIPRRRRQLRPVRADHGLELDHRQPPGRRTQLQQRHRGLGRLQPRELRTLRPQPDERPPNTAPALMALADNGGPTQTMAPQLASPAIDQGKAATGETVTSVD